MNQPALASEIEIDSAALLRAVENFIAQFVVLPPGALLPIALWAIATHLFHLFDLFPYLLITSPAPRCGKTRLLEVLELLCASAERTSNISEGALFPLIEKMRPTLLLDEMESLRDRSQRTQVFQHLLNAGNRSDAVAIRRASASAAIERRPVYCPKALASIGAMPETIADRGIVVSLQRRTRREKIARFLIQHARQHAALLQPRISAWAALCAQDIQAAYATMPDLEFLQDRDAESWAPLFVVLSLADPARLNELRRSALMLSAQRHYAAPDFRSLQLLLDAEAVLSAGEDGFISNVQLLSRLRSLPESPWADSALTTNKLALLLAPFRVRPHVVRTATAILRGYDTEHIRKSAARYKQPAS